MIFVCVCVGHIPPAPPQPRPPPPPHAPVNMVCGQTWIQGQVKLCLNCFWKVRSFRWQTCTLNYEKQDTKSLQTLILFNETLQTYVSRDFYRCNSRLITLFRHKKIPQLASNSFLHTLTTETLFPVWKHSAMWNYRERWCKRKVIERLDWSYMFPHKSSLHQQDMILPHVPARV